MASDSARIWPVVLVGALATIGGLVGVGHYAASSWVTRWTPLSVFVTAVCLPFVSLAAVFAVYDRPEMSAVEALKGPLAVALGFSLAGAAVAASWSLPAVRVDVLGQLQGEKWRPADVGALQDAADEVRILACRKLIERGPASDRGRLLGSLQERPQVAASCLGESVDASDAAVASTAAELSWVLQQRWIREARETASSSPKRACRQLAPSLDLPERGRVAIPELARCALDGWPQLGDCCTRTLADQVGTGQQLVDVLRSGATREVTEALAVPFFQAAVHRFQLDEATSRRVARLGLDTDSGKRLGFQLACKHALEAPRPEETFDQLSSWVDHRGCAVDPGSLADQPSEWRAVCRELGASLQEAEDLGGQVCREVRRHRRRLAVREAQSTIYGALQGANRARLAASVRRGAAGRSRAKRSGDRFRQLVQGLMGAGQEVSPNSRVSAGPESGPRALLDSMANVASSRDEELEELREENSMEDLIDKAREKAKTEETRERIDEAAKELEEAGEDASERMDSNASR